MCTVFQSSLKSAIWLKHQQKFFKVILTLQPRKTGILYISCLIMVGCLPFLKSSNDVGRLMVRIYSILI